MTKSGAKVAILNSSEDTVEMLRIQLENAGMATVGGLVLLAIALLLRPVVSRWAPALILLAAVIWYLRGGEQVLFAGAWLLLTIAFVPLGIRVWSDTGSRRLS